MDINYSYVGNFISKSELRNFGRLIELIIENNTKDSVEFGDRLNDEFITGAINNFFEESLIEPLGIVGAIENAISQKLFTILDELDMEDHEAGIYADLLNEYGEVEMFYDIFNLETYDIIKNTVKYIIDNNLITESKQTFNKLYTSINEFKKYLYEEKDKEITPVIFRYDEKHDEIYAIFPFEIVDTNRNVMTYAHIGQHGVGDYEHMMNTSREATPEEYSDLKNELENRVGYNLKIITDKKEEY